MKKLLKHLRRAARAMAKVIKLAQAMDAQAGAELARMPETIGQAVTSAVRAKAKAVRTRAREGATWGDTIRGVQAAAAYGEGANRKLADVLGVAPSTISNWLSGQRAPRGEPRTRLAELAQQHGVSWPGQPIESGILGTPMDQPVATQQAATPPTIARRPMRTKAEREQAKAEAEAVLAKPKRARKLQPA